MFTHLHTHTEFSLLDGLSTIPELVSRAKALGQEALAITDHGALYGALKFYEAARAQEINPIIGLEAYVAPQSRLERNPAERSPYHLTLLAQNEAGYRNLLRLSSASHLEGFYQRPRIDREVLAAHSDGLIVLSGCPSGEVMRALRDGRTEAARETVGWYRDLFGDRYYAELQEHHDPEFSGETGALIALAREFGIAPVLTNDSHYTMREQDEAHDVLLCIGTQSTVAEENRMKFANDSFYLKSEDEMRALLPEIPEACDETARIAEQVDIRLDFERTLLPDPGIPEGETPATYLRALCNEGLRRRYPNASDEQRERLDYELSVIDETGFNEYILIVRDIADFARSRDIPMGVRGSAAASIVLHCLDVTDIEPTQYRLVFERFLNLERREMPDVDFDFADDRREEVIRYTAERYGSGHVAQIITFGTLGARAAIRDVGRALGMGYGDVDRVARLVPKRVGVTLDEALASGELAEARNGDDQVRTLVDTARGLEGVARHVGTHAAGVIISREPLVEVVPLQRATGERLDAEMSLPTTQFDMNDVAKIGLLKLDFLGLANLTILGRTFDLIGRGLTASDIPDGDTETADLLASGETFGVFQLESSGMRGWVRALRPQGIRELAAVIALYRPGPMEHIEQYVDTKFGREQVRYPHPDLASILDETYGVITYQDQVLEIARSFAGYTLGQADVMRKAMGKKIAAVMVTERENFVAGAVLKGYDRTLAEQLFSLIEPFAGYAFNKAHAFSYATIAYHTAWLKAHYPVEFMTAVLMSASSHSSNDRVSAAIAESARMNIEVLPPDINASDANFTVDGERSIRFGLAQVSTVGQAAAEALLEERAEGGAFLSIEDFATRIDPDRCHRNVIEALAKAGSFDSIVEGTEYDRAAVVFGGERIIATAQNATMQRKSGQMSLFDGMDVEIPKLHLDAAQATPREIGAWEHDLLGAYVSAHPFQGTATQVREWITHQMSDLDEDLVGAGQVVVAGTVTNVRRLTTQRGDPFCEVTVEDLSGSANVTVWPDKYRDAGTMLTAGTVVIVRVSLSEWGERVRVAADRLARWDEQLAAPEGSWPRPQRRMAEPPVNLRGNHSGAVPPRSNGDRAAVTVPMPERDRPNVVSDATGDGETAPVLPNVDTAAVPGAAEAAPSSTPVSGRACLNGSSSEVSDSGGNGPSAVPVGVDTAAVADVRSEASSSAPATARAGVDGSPGGDRSDAPTPAPAQVRVNAAAAPQDRVEPAAPVKAGARGEGEGRPEPQRKPVMLMINESGDADEDKRKLTALMDIVQRNPGAEPLRLRVQSGSGSHQDLDLPAVESAVTVAHAVYAMLNGDEGAA